MKGKLTWLGLKVRMRQLELESEMTNNNPLERVLSRNFASHIYLPDHDIIKIVEMIDKTKELRITPSQKYSVFDIINKVTRKTGQREAWKRLVEQYPSLSVHCSQHKFPGRGQQFTPVIDITGVIEIMYCLPGKIIDRLRANNFVNLEECSEGRDAPGYHYLLSSGSAVKFGYSRNPEKRLQELQTASARKLVMIAQKAGTEKEEKAFHVENRRKAISGEWYPIKYLDYIKQTMGFSNDNSR